MRTLAVSLCLAVLTVGTSTDAPRGHAAPIRLGPGPQLFVDDYLIASQQGLRRIVGSPLKRPEPIVDAARDHNYQPYLTVRRERGVFRLWYSAKLSDESLALGYATSRDGIHFRRPVRLLRVPTGYQYGASIIRDRHGYLLPYYARAATSGADADKGLAFARSKNGLSWKATTKEPLFTARQVGLKRAPADITSLFRFGGRYLLLVKMNGTGYKGVTPNMPFPGYRRIVGVMESHDGASWSLPRPIFTPDARDPGITEFYGVGGVVKRGGLLVGFLRVLRDDLPADEGGPAAGLGYTVLAWSRDGRTWRRDRQPFLDRGAPGSWDRAMAWADAQAVVGDRTLVYYGGYRSGHKPNPTTERQLGVATIRRDRYVARSGTGTLITRLVRLSARALTVNAAVRGRLAIRLRERGGRVAARCAVARGDSVRLPVRCDRKLPSAPVRIEFRLQDADVYSFGLR